MRRVVLASGNPAKLRELRRLLVTTGLEVVPQCDLGVTTIEETGETFMENAVLKARHASRSSGLPAIADDSGIEVDALGGAPGVYSARYAGPRASDADNLAKLLDALTGVPWGDRGARFQCVMVFLLHPADPAPTICRGTWVGRILEAPRGRGGFGYDPVFFAPQQGCSAAELPAAEKDRIGHRGRAMRCLLARLRQGSSP